MWIELKMTDKAFIYARVSSQRQEEEGFSIPAQLELLRDYAHKNSFVIEQEFSEAKTAKQEGREAFNAMIKAATLKGGAKTILVEKVDRLLRNFKDFCAIDELIKEHGITIHLVKENETLSSSSSSSAMFMFGIRALMAKNYIDNLSEETKKGKTQRAKLGLWCHMAPYGYKNGGVADQR